MGQKKKAVSLLKYHRLQQALTQEQVADKLYDLCIADGHPGAGVNAQMVSKWELGTYQPSLLYQRLLAVLLKVSVRELGFVDPLSQLVVHPRPSEGYSFVSHEWEARDFVYREWGPGAGSWLQPQASGEY